MNQKRSRKERLRQEKEKKFMGEIMDYDKCD